MGLDNIPKNYPCKSKGTAVMVRRLDKDGQPIRGQDGEFVESISCEETANRNACPYQTAVKASGMTEGAVYGMFGTPCWYRGKWGNYLMQALDGSEGEYDFYGDNEEGTEKSPESCRATADYMEGLLNDKIQDSPEFIVNGEDLIPQIRYAIWWLRWTADEADGSTCWY